jgi:hypothetical protein
VGEVEQVDETEEGGRGWKRVTSTLTGQKKGLSSEVDSQECSLRKGGGRQMCE